MSYSSDWVDERIEQLQEAINERRCQQGLFELKELVPDEEWEALGTKRTAVTSFFKKRIVGFSGAREPVLTNIQVRRVRQNGRERMFERIEGDANPRREDEPFEGAI